MRILFLMICTLFLNLDYLSAQNQNDKQEVVVQVNGHLLKLKQETKGLLTLLSHTYIHQETRQIAAHFSEVIETEQQRYFLLQHDGLLEITPYNYREVVHKYLPLAKELHKRLGKRGFRYENLVDMVHYYNRFKAPSARKNIFTAALAEN